MTPKSGKAIAWLSFTLGILVSIAGNIGHAASDGMKPGEWAGAAFWPLALMLTIEILTRVRWQPGKRWTVARFAALVLVAAVAAVLSYRHLAGLMTYWGEDPLNAYLGPLAVDGLMLIAATALLSISKERLVQPEATQVPVSAPEQVPVSDAAPAVGTQPTPVFADQVNGSAAVVPETSKTDEEIRQLVNTLSSKVTPDPEPDKPTLINNMETGVLEPKEPKVSTVTRVPSSAAVEHATQIWLNADPKPSVRKLAHITGLSASKAHRLISDLKEATAR